MTSCTFIVQMNAFKLKLAIILYSFCTTAVVLADFSFDGSTRRPDRVGIKVEPICNPSKEDNLTVLSCICTDSKILKLGHRTPHARIISIRYLQTKSNGLRISDCTEVHIYSSLEWLYRETMTHPIQVVSFERLGSLYPYESRVFDFRFQSSDVPVKFLINKVKNPIRFPTNLPDYTTLNGSIKQISFESVDFLDFNTNGLNGVSTSEPHVVFNNCTIKTKDPRSESRRISLSSLNILNSSLIGAGTGSFNISVPNFKIINSNIELITGKSFDVHSHKAEFVQSRVELQANSLRIKSQIINFINVTFDQPKSLSLIELTPESFNGPDMIRFYNITLIDPSRGALVTGGFRTIEFKNVTMSNCLCDLHVYLLDNTISAFTLRMFHEIERQLQQDLKNNSQCFDQIHHNLHPIENCEDIESYPRFDIIYISITLVLFIGIVSIIATIATVYLLNKRSRDKRIAMIKEWSMALPRPKSYRETLVKFNLESVQMFSRPGSMGYAEQQNEPDLIQGLDKMDELKQEIKEEQESKDSYNMKSDDSDECCENLGGRDVRTALSVIIEEDDLVSLDEFEVYKT